MGLYVLLKDADYNDYPGWDFGLAGDKQFPDWMGKLLNEVEYCPSSEEDRDLFRPLDIAAWRARLPADRPNPDRFTQMFDILETEATWWIYFSWCEIAGGSVADQPVGRNADPRDALPPYYNPDGN